MPFMDVVRMSDARFFVMENVPQLLNTAEHASIIHYAEENGFKTWSGVLTATDYGVPQARKRAFIIGSKTADPKIFFPPKKTNYNPSIKLSRMELVMSGYTENAAPYATVRNAIGDLPDPVGTEIRNESAPLDLHFGRTPTPKSMERYKAVPEEGMNRFDLLKNAPELTPLCWIKKKKGGTDLFGRLWWDRPSFTIRTEFFKPEKGRYLHPAKHRPITHREAARLQTFPDNFMFTGTKIEIAKQIGNAVPPLLAARVATTLYDMIEYVVQAYA
jgi:DNA (cytosine-5)-methyltransferase 1